MKFELIDTKIKSYTENETLYIKGVANTGQEDMDGDIIAPDALQKIAETAINRNLHLEHDRTIDGIIGTIVESEITGRGVEIKASILPEYADKLKHLLNNGIKLGLSVQGIATYQDNRKEKIKDWELIEISLTPIPCDQDTMGTVAIVKSLKELLKKEDKGEGKMAENETITKDEVIELINTANSENKEELIATILEEVKTEFGAVITELQEKVGTLEEQLKASDEAPAEEEQKAEDEEKEDEEKAEDEEEEKEEEEKADTDDEEKEDEEEKLEKALNYVFQPVFKYNKQKALKEQKTKSAHTPRELAKMLIG